MPQNLPLPKSSHRILFQQNNQDLGENWLFTGTEYEGPVDLPTVKGRGFRLYLLIWDAASALASEALVLRPFFFFSFFLRPGFFVIADFPLQNLFGMSVQFEKVQKGFIVRQASGASRRGLFRAKKVLKNVVNSFNLS